MGSVVVDILIDKKERKEAHWIIKWLPFILLSFLSVIYLLILFDVLADDFFDRASDYSIIVDIVAFIYCFAIKIENFTRR